MLMNGSYTPPAMSALQAMCVKVGEGQAPLTEYTDMARFEALTWSTSRAKVPVADDVAVYHTSPEFGYTPQGGGAMPEVPVAPAVEPGSVVHEEDSAGKLVAPATAGQLGMFGLHDAGGVEVQGSSPGFGQEPAEQEICSKAVFAPAPQDGSCTRMK